MSGKITVIVGPMFSGKTTEWIKQMNTCKIMGHTVKAFTPDIHGIKINSRNGYSWSDYRALPLKFSDNRIDDGIAFQDCFFGVSFDDEVFRPNWTVGIEEAQFFEGPGFVDAIRDAANTFEVSFVISGLSRDYRGAPFGHMPTLLGMADEIIQCKAVCDVCKRQEATRTVRTTEDTERVIIGSDCYGARCYKCR